MKILRKVFEDVMLVTGVGLLIAALVAYHPQDAIKPAHAQPTILGPIFSFFTAVTAAQQIVNANPSRHGLQICNPGSTNALWIAPQGNATNTGAAVTPAANTGYSVPPVASNVTNCFAPPVGVPSVGQAWNGFSTTTPVIVFEWP